MNTPSAWSTLTINLALIAAVVTLGLKHSIDSQVISTLLGALAGGHLVTGSGAISNMLAIRAQRLDQPSAK